MKGWQDKQSLNFFSPGHVQRRISSNSRLGWTRLCLAVSLGGGAKRKWAPAEIIVKIPFKCKKKLLSNTGTVCSEVLWSLHPQTCLKPNWTMTWSAFSSWLRFEQGLWASSSPEVPAHLSDLVILWFSESWPIYNLALKILATCAGWGTVLLMFRHLKPTHATGYAL